MLELKVGDDAFFAALRRLTREQMGKFTDWDDIQRAFEAESGDDLDWFFDQWVRRGGAPLLELTGAEWQPGSEELTVWLSQGETDFVLDVPLRLHYADGAVDVTATMSAPADKVTVPCRSSGLQAVELDPDYHVFRKLKPEEVMPTSALTRRSQKLVIVVPPGELNDSYQTVVDSFTKAVLGDAEEPKPGREVNVLTTDQVSRDDLSDAGVLIIGDAVRNETVADLLSKTVCPVTWTESAFATQEQKYADPGQAVFFTVHHPDQPDNGVTVYYGNTEDALANARVLSYYPNSLLVFQTPVGAGAPTGAAMGHGDMHGHRPHTEVILRMDFESHDRIEF
jgi:hypothetical protein